MQGDTAMAATIRRRILTIDGRRVHLRHAGNGLRLLLIHGSPASSEFLSSLINQLSRHFSCLAPDTPGFGESEPMALDMRTIPAAAAATASLLDFLKFGPCLVFGTHTGAAIALELAIQRPDLVGGLLLDGVALFNATEQHLFEGYFEPVLVDERGGHFARCWTRIRDMFLWFPWTSRAPEQLNGTDLPPVTSTHCWVSMLYQAAPHYADLYRAAIAYTDRALLTAATQTRPAIYLAHERDMLSPHLARLPPLKQSDRVRLTSSAPGEWTTAVEQALRELESSHTIGSGPLCLTEEPTRADQFVDLPHGQLRLRRFGSLQSPPLLLVHDAPGSGLMLSELAKAMAHRWCVWVPDLPGCGSSQPLAQSVPTLADYASSLDGMLATLSTRPWSIYGRGCGAAVALHLALRQTARIVSVVLDELLIADPERPPLDSRFCPQITLEADGAHWFRTWQMLRDSQIFWPWYDTSARSLLRIPGNFSGEFLHEWTAQVLQQPETAHCLPAAALAMDAKGLFPLVQGPLILMARRGHPLAQGALRVQADFPHFECVAYEQPELAMELDRRLPSSAHEDPPSDRIHA